jgi:hypothetical protein
MFICLSLYACCVHTTRLPAVLNLWVKNLFASECQQSVNRERSGHELVLRVETTPFVVCQFWNVSSSKGMLQSRSCTERACSIADSVLGRVLRSKNKILVTKKLGPSAWSVWQAVVMEVEVLMVASHLTPILLPCILILEVCSGQNNGTKWVQL